MIIHGTIQKCVFNAPKEGSKDARTGEVDKGLFMVYWLDASRPSELRSTQTLLSYVSADSIEAMIKVNGNPDLADFKVTVSVNEFKIDKGGAFYVRGPLFPGHLTAEEVIRAKRGVTANAEPVALPTAPPKAPVKAA